SRYQTQMTATCTNDRDAVVSDLAGSAPSTNGGFIVTLTYGGAQHTFGDANTGVTGVVLDLAGGDDSVQLSQNVTIPVSIDGGAGKNTLIGGDGENTWVLTGADTGTLNGQHYEHIQNLIGGSGADAFRIDSGGSVSGTIDGGAGENSLLAGDVSNTWVLTGQDMGTLTRQAFANIGNLIGGSRDDTFVLGPAGAVSGSIDGGTDDALPAPPGIDRLDYTGRTSDVEVHLEGKEYVATDVAHLSGIDVFVGGSGSDTLFGPDLGQGEWSITGVNSGTVAEIYSFEGFQNLKGVDNTTSDLFTFEADGSLTGHLDGGAGASDSLRVLDGATGLYTIFNPSTVDAAGTESLAG